MIHKKLSDITEADLQALVDTGATEGLTLEFKRDPPGPDREGAKEFLADVSALANRCGGDLVFGISERANEDGQNSADELVGMLGVDADTMIARLENQLRDSIAPRVVGISFRAIPLSGGRIALIVRVPKSWNSPHVVDHSGHWRFYVRNSRGRHPMSIDEVRNAFLQSATVADRIHELRAARTTAVRQEIDGNDVPTIVVHVIPLVALDPDNFIDLDRARLVRVPFHSLDWIENETHLHEQTDRFRFEGFERFGRRADGYTLVFRNGVIEGVDRFSLTKGARPDGTIPPVNFSHLFPHRLNRGIRRYLDGLGELGIDGPVAVAITLLAVGGHRLESPPLMPGYAGGLSRHAIDRTDLELPLRLLPSPAEDSTTLVQELVDMIWNAAGESRSSVRLVAEPR